MRLRVSVCACALCVCACLCALARAAPLLYLLRCPLAHCPISLFQTTFSRGFTKNMKLEAVNPRNPGELCVASVVSVKGRLMWLHLEGTLGSPPSQGT